MTIEQSFIDTLQHFLPTPECRRHRSRLNGLRTSSCPVLRDRLPDKAKGAAVVVVLIRYVKVMLTLWVNKLAKIRWLSELPEQYQERKLAWCRRGGLSANQSEAGTGHRR